MTFTKENTSTEERERLSIRSKRGFLRTFITGAFLAGSVAASMQAPTAAPVLLQTGYVPVHGLTMFYETLGAGPPLVLLHGSLSTIETDFGRLLPTFALTRKVIGIEQQAHGHTADLDRPLRVEQMAEDTAELLFQLKVEKADFLGYSLGGAVALQIAKRHPGLVQKLVFVGGASYSPAGLYPEIVQGTANLKPEALAGTLWQKAYARMAPVPEHWSTLVEKIRSLNQNYPKWTETDLKAIQIPVLLMIGDSDIVRPEHTVQMFRLLGGGVPGDVQGLPRSQLAVLPGTTHVTILSHTDWLTSMINAFYNAPLPTSHGVNR